jgi:lysozyme
MTLRLFALLALSLAPCTVLHSGFVPNRLVTTALTGVDVSHHQKEIDWDVVAVHDNVDFAFVKATEGSDFVDSMYCRNWEHLGRTTIRRGAYHFFRAYGCGDTQAAHFLNTIEMRPGDLPPVLDVETLDGQSPEVLRQEMHVWLQTVENALGLRPIIYSNQDFYERFLSMEFGEKYPLWIARYGDTPPRLTQYRPWTFWQKTNEGCVEGISSKVDINSFPGDIEMLDQLTWKPAPTTFVTP